MNKEEEKFCKLSKENKLKCFALYTYELKKLSKSEAVRFVYLLKGRDGQAGIVEEFNGEFLANGCFLVSMLKDDEIREIMDKWHIKYKRRLVITN